jgi:cytochrome c biogenesis protein
VKEGNGFANTLTQYDDFRAGKLFNIRSMPNFFFTLNNFTVEFERSINQKGSPRKFEADIRLNDKKDLKVLVNKPFNVNGTKIYLTGHGYAPRIEVLNPRKEIIFSDSVVFLPQDGNFSSTGVIKIADESPQLGINARFLPTAKIDPINGPTSTFPGLDNPQIFMSLWQGDMGVNDGISQSIYKLDTSKMTELGLEELKPGESWITDQGFEIRFQSVEQFASFQVAYEPGRFLALLGAIFAMLGMFFGLGIQRRRIWVLMPRVEKGPSVIEVAGLAKSTNHDISKDIEKILAELSGKRFIKKGDRTI